VEWGWCERIIIPSFRAARFGLLGNEKRKETQCGKCKYYSEMKVYGDEGGDEEEESRAFGGERRGVG
jgi:hypothetical protein